MNFGHTKRIEKLKQISQLLNEYQSVLAVVSHDGSRVAAFSAVVSELQNLESALLVPLRVIIQQRVALHARIRSEVLPALSRAMSLAATLNDATMTHTLSFFYKDLRTNTSAGKALNAMKVVLGYVALHATEAAAVGFDTAAVAALQQLVEEAEGMRLLTQQRGSLRSVDRNQLKRLLSEATRILRNEIDWMVEKHQSSEPVLYERYRLLRKYRKGSKQAEVFTDISGTVTDGVTGKPIAGALVFVVGNDDVNATTDADGYYLIDDPAPGAYQLRCTAQGYQIPADVAFSIAEGASLQVNFSLLAQQAVA